MMLIVGVTVRFIPDLVSVSKRKNFPSCTASSYFTASSQMVSSFD